MDKTITMSKKELSRLEIMQRLEDKRLRQKEAAQIMGIGIRQVKRLYRAYREKGAEGLISRKPPAFISICIRMSRRFARRLMIAPG